MRLCIADPPYLGRGAIWYGDGGHPSHHGNRGCGSRRADSHPEAHVWDDIDTHRQLVNRLIADYDGWAIAMAHDNLRDYLPMIPATERIRIGSWQKRQTMPGGARVINAWEPVIVRIPDGRREAKGSTIFPRDTITTGRVEGFTGAKPAAWTRWVLDMLGYDPETDTVDDMFHGSGAVAAEIAQGVLL